MRTVNRELRNTARAVRQAGPPLDQYRAGEQRVEPAVQQVRDIGGVGVHERRPPGRAGPQAHRRPQAQDEGEVHRRDAQPAEAPEY
jgi:hypothetical protein